MGALPAGWADRWRQRADLEVSFNELEGCTHFYARVCQGRLRSLQLRHLEADRLFEAAAEGLGRHATEDPDTAAFALALVAAKRENDLLLGREIPPLGPVLWLRTPDLRIRRTVAILRGIDAAAMLGEGSSSEALAAFQEVLRIPELTHETRAVQHLGVAACLSNLGRAAEAQGQLELAGLHVTAIDGIAGQSRLAARLWCCFSELGAGDEAATWRSFLGSLPCPEATLGLFLRRAKLIAAKSRALGYQVTL